MWTHEDGCRNCSGNADVITGAEVGGIGDAVTAVRKRYSHQKVKECRSEVQMAVTARWKTQGMRKG